MKTIIIPGYSHKNKEWAEETSRKISDSVVYEWKHWNDPTIRFSAKDEAQNIKSLIGNGEVNIIAKSIGTLVAMMAIRDSIAKIVFCGIPINDLNEDDLWQYKILSDFPPQKIIVFQNSEDEHGSFVAVRKFLSQINPNIKIIEKSGKTHDYPYFEEFNEFLKE